ncbi:MAG: gamma-glutamyl-gamma-aminobutyrate hydrolase family protein [Alphaproteobacteria bacterium]|nr:gamma-glutamyl-gamma-aminobutyrate hydrolase family protein [Alphaproteobacteria bacterium]
MTNNPAQPVIAISCADVNTPSAQAMIKRVSEAGGAPMVIDDHIKRNMREDFDQLHGIVIMGSDFDVDPIHYIQRYPDGDPRRKIHPATRSELECEHAKARAKYEMAFMKRALQQKMPMLCICAGMQRLNVLCGGTLHQHVPDMIGHDRLTQNQYNIPGEVGTRAVLIEPATRMSIIAKKIQMHFVQSKSPGLPTVIMENSFRHQSIEAVGEGLRVCALSDVVRQKDGTSRYLIEGIEATPEGPYGQQFLIGVQWHPEFCASEIGRVLVKDFIKHAAAHI